MKKTTIIVIISLFFTAFSSVCVIGSTTHQQFKQMNMSTTHIVDDEGDGDYQTIQAAIDQATTGDIIQVYSGQYNENIHIQQPGLTIEGKPYELGLGSDNDHPVIQGTATGDVIRIETTDTMITGFIIQGSGDDYFDAGIGIYQSNNNINGNGIAGNFYGIVCNNCSQNIITENIILANVMDGIYLFSTHQNIITKNTIKENGFQGIFLYETNQNDISQNTIALNDRDGIQFRNLCFDNNICHNIIHSNNWDGMKVRDNDVSNNLIKKNNIYSNGYHGIHLMRGNENQFLQNDITLNHINGIHLGDSDRNLITGNTFTDNQEEGIYILFEGSDDNEIYHNNFINDNAYDNGDNQWYNDDISTGNYWSYYTGSDEDNDGIGDKPYNIPGDKNQDNYPLMTPLLPPEKPQRPRGTSIGTIGETYRYTTKTTSTQLIQYGWDWDGDKHVDEWTPFYESDQLCETYHTWEDNGTYPISVKAMDSYGLQSDWSDPLTVTMPKTQNPNNPLITILQHIIQHIFEEFHEILSTLFFFSF